MIQANGHLWRRIQDLSLIVKRLEIIQNWPHIIKHLWSKVDHEIVNSKPLPSHQNTSILVASDEPFVLEQFGALIGYSSPRIMSCTQLSDELKEQPAAVFLDISAPGISQQQLSWLIRDRSIAVNAPIVLLTNELRLCHRWNAWDSPYHFVLRPTNKRNLPQFRAGIQRIFYELGLSY